MLVLLVLLAAWLVFLAAGAVVVHVLASWQHSALLRLGRDVTATTHFYKMKHASKDDPVVFFAPPADRLHHWCFGTFRSGGIVAPAVSQACGRLSHCAPRRDVHRQCKCGTARSDTAGQTANPLWLRAPMQMLFIALLWWSTRV
jgi:hypothetical protein